MTPVRHETKRWLIAGAAVVMQLCLGSVYAWSIFKKPLMAAHGWSETSTQGTFMIYSFTFAVSVALGGMLVDRKGPRSVGILGGLLFGAGLFLAGLAVRSGSILMLYGAYGIISGIGGGIGYVTPITTLIRWFPDRRGLVTGLAVMGYGFGSFIMGKAGPRVIISFGIDTTFFIWGALSLFLVLGSVLLFQDPPEGWTPAGWSVKDTAGKVPAMASFTFSEAVRTIQFWTLWTLVFLIVTAGLGLISQLSPLAQDVLLSKMTGPVSKAGMDAVAITSGGIVAMAAVFNGAGRLLWAWVSDTIGRKRVFVILFLTGATGCLFLTRADDITLFTILICYLLACYGGGLACMPAFTADEFGHAHIGKIYGVIFSACGIAGIVGPLIFARIRDMTSSFTPALYITAVMLSLGLFITLLYRSPRHHQCPAGNGYLRRDA